MASRLFSNRRAPLKKATTLISKQTLEKAIQEGHALADLLIEKDSQGDVLEKVQEAVSFLTSILKKAPLDMQQEGASSLDDYLDDAVMPDMAQKIKQDVDMIAKLKNAAPTTSTPVMAGGENWVSDRDEDGSPEKPELAEVPRMAAKKVDPLFATPKKAAPVAPATPAPNKPSADINQLSSDTLAKMQKALAGSEDLMNDKAAQAFIAAIAETLMNRPVETEQEAAPAAPAAAAPAPLPVAASLKMFAGLNLIGSEAIDKTAGTWMNQYEIEQAVEMLGSDPVLGPAARFLQAFAEEVNNNSDGWPYWQAPARAAGKLMDLVKAGVDARYRGSKSAVTSSDVARALSPIKAFMTTKGAQAGMVMPKLATAQGGSFINDGDTGDVIESGGRTPEIEAAHKEIDDNTGIKRPATEAPIKFASDMTTGKAVKLMERVGEDLKKLYLEVKPVTQVLDSRPVRDAVESVFRAYDFFGEGVKAINKLRIQEENEAAAVEVKDKNKKKTGGVDPKLNNEGRSDEGDSHPDFCECADCTHNALHDSEYKTSSLFGLSIASEEDEG